MKELYLKDSKIECNPKAFGEILIRYREMNGISQRQLARKCGVSNATISRIEKGLDYETEVRVVYIISKALRLNFFEIFGALYPQIYEEYKDVFELFKIIENNMNAKQKKATSEIIQILGKLLE